jgi:hypothetical protein
VTCTVLERDDDAKGDDTALVNKFQYQKMRYSTAAEPHVGIHQ